MYDVIDRAAVAKAAALNYFPERGQPAGRCRLCRSVPLTRATRSREHVPARSSLLGPPGDRAERWGFIPRGRPKLDGLASKVIQDGLQFPTLCRDCNNGVSSATAGAYGAFAQALQSSPNLLAPDGVARLVRVNRPRAVARAMATVMLAIEPEAFADLHVGLREFAQGVHESIEPPFRFLAYLVPDSKRAGVLQRFHGRIPVLGPGGEVTAGEISRHPFGWIYASGTIGSAYRPDLLTDVGDWFRAEGEDTGSTVALHTRLAGIDSVNAVFGGNKPGPTADYL